MKTTMRQAFEDCAVPKQPTTAQVKLAKQIIKRMDKQDESAQRKRVRKAHPVSQVREQ